LIGRAAGQAELGNPVHRLPGRGLDGGIALGLRIGESNSPMGRNFSFVGKRSAVIDRS
jgi:hypothetical protein